MPCRFRATCLASLAWILAWGAPARAGAPTEAEAGTELTAGSGRYRGLSFFADGEWKRREWSPYAHAELESDTYGSQLELFGGASKELDGTDLKAGLGLLSGRLRESETPGSALGAELGLEKDLDGPTIEAVYRVTEGTIGSYAAERSLGPTLDDEASRRETFSTQELSGEVVIPAGKSSVGARLTWAKPSFDGATWSAALSWKSPLGPGLSLRVELSVDHGSSSGVYLTGGVSYRFSP